MPTYDYVAKKGPSEIVKDKVVAESRDKAVARVEAMGYFPITVIESTPAKAPEGDPGKDFSGKGTGAAPRVGSRDLDTFIWQLASLMRSSIPLLRALMLIAKQTRNKNFKIVIEDLGNRIRQGELLSEAMGQYPSIFNHLTLGMIRTGERSGSLDEVLFKLAEHREKEQETRRKIQSALAYPMVVVVTGVGTVFLMFTFFLPKLTRLFSGMKQELPWVTKLLISSSGFMSHYGVLGITGIALLIAVVAWKTSGNKKKRALDALTLRVPFINRFVTTSEMARFSRSLGLLLKNGIPVYESLPLATETLDNLVLKARLAEASEAMMNRGCTLSESFNRSGVFPEFLLSMIAVGEESGKLEESLDQIASSYEKEVDQTIKIMVSMVEPLLIIGVGGIVGVIVFAMLLPILNMGGMGQ
ncbi:MAG: type II secretion system F family protein [Candidatus Omnitrophota bacterium]